MAYTMTALDAELTSSEMSDLTTEILASSMRSIGLLDNATRRIADLRVDSQPVQYYERWLDGSIRHLQEQGVLASDLTFRRDIRPSADLWAEWEAKASAWASDPRRQARAALVKACLERLPAVLSGNERAADVIFPNSSTHLVDAIDRGDPRTEFCNDVLAETLSASMAQQLQSDPERRFRIIEIGAGRGGTTRALLPVVNRYPVEEYRYTDLSEAFLAEAERQFHAVCPVLTTSVFDVSLPLESQSVAMNYYDFAIAADVLHAAANVRAALRNAKAALKNGGVLLLNEISTWSLFDHLTFGLLEEWWRYHDAVVRRPGSPGLSTEGWRELLTTEGFESIAIPAEKNDRFGWQTISAASNGWTRQRIARNAPLPRPDPVDVIRPVVSEPQTLAAAPVSTVLSEQLAVDHTRQVITSKLAEVLRLSPGLIRDDAPFAGYGVDSIAGVSLVRAIGEALAIDLEATSLFEYSTVDELTAYIVNRWRDEIKAQVAQVSGPNVTTRVTADEKPAEVVPSPAQQAFGTTRFTARFTDIGIASVIGDCGPVAAGVEPIAIIGMSGRFADSESPEAFWQHLADGHDLVKKVSRWSPEACVMSDPANDEYCSYGSFIESIDQFDPTFFGISEHEATYMDPQQRLFLEESWRALEDAGYASKGVSEKQCGVYAGCGSSKYDRLHPREIPPAHAFWGNSSAVTPARIAYLLNLQGPALAVDTACSSSLVAIHLACQGLWSRETEMALAGGVFLNTTPAFFQVANRAHMLSPDGKCHSFDARANGFVPGEGVGVLVLKRLSDAIVDGDYIHGVIAGSGINQDGRSNGLTAPNGRAQERLARSVYERFRIDPGTIQVVEAHGTGSLLGDSVEHAALSRAFREHTNKRQFCALGTVKTNIGHTSAASGVAGVLKVLLSMKHRMIPPSLHFEKANPAIDIDSGPFYVNTQLKIWDAAADQVRRAAVSSFGFGGTNAHLIVDEAPALVRRDDAARAYVVVLSARSGEQLKQQARNLLAHVERTPNLSMTDLSFTLLLGRMHFDHRLACIAQNQSELVHLLEQWVESGAAPNVYAAEIQEGRPREKVALKKFGSYCIEACQDSPNADSYAENLTVIADLYVQGYALEFGSLFPKDARRMPLPTYPFARQRYWIEGEPETLSFSEEDDDVAFEEAETVGHSAGTIPSHSNAREAGGTLQDELSGLLADLLGTGSGKVSPERVLQDLGIDSVGLTKLAEAINGRYQLDITPVVFFDYPTIGELAKYLSEKYGNDLRRVAGASTASRPASNASTPLPGARLVPRARGTSRKPRRDGSSGGPAGHEPIAIVGMAGVMPQSDDLDELWEHLANGRNVITVIPRDRWNWEDGFGDPLKEVNKYNTKWGGFMREVDKFDPRFFAISPREAQMMDPQQRIFLQTAWKAIEDAGEKASDLSGTKTGIFVAAGNNDYKEVLRNVEGGLDGYSASGNTNSVLANRISFLLNLRGPSENVDTACSSALIALHRAIHAIHAGDCAMAIVGGVNAIVSPEPYIAFSKAGLLSRDGQCKTFDKRANGFVRAEGSGAVFIKRLSAAEADGNHIYAIVRSTAVNHGGRVPTMGAPSASGQTALHVEAYENARIDPTTVGYIECHGTGTALGDPIETEALRSAFAELYKRHAKAPAETPHCGLGSIKTNIGHLENAAGIAGLVKVLLALKHKQLPASLNFQDLNPYIKLDGTPFYVVDKLTRWVAPTAPDGSPLPRRAGVSSFGFGGANAHVVLEEYIPPVHESRGQEHGPQLIVLSAKNADRLKDYAQSMLTYFAKMDVDLRDLAYTLQVGRDEMPERLAFIAESSRELKQKLETFLEGRGKSSDVHHDNSKTSAPQGTDQEAQVRALVDQKDFAKLAELWTRGAKIDWAVLHEGASPKRISLPTYPFARERHWAVSADADGTKASRVPQRPGATVLHPMVHRNVSTMTEQKFASRFSGDEFFFDDHRVQAQRVLPAVGYLEMVRAAGQLAGLPVRSIRNITWQRPLIVGNDGEEVEVSLAPDNKDVKFSVRTADKGQAVQNCSGKLTYAAGAAAVSEMVDVAAIRARCSRQALSGPELYGPALAGSGLELRRSFQVVQAIYANDSEAFGILHIPEHLRAEAGQYFLHPALMDGAIQTFVGLVHRSGSEPLPLTLPFAMGEVQIFRSLKDLRYAHVMVAGESKLAVDMLDERGTVLVRVKDFVLRPVQRPGRTANAIVRESEDPSAAATPRKETATSLQTLTPVWNPMRVDASQSVAVSPSADVLRLGSEPTHLEWVRASFANVRSAEVFADEAFEQLIWIAPEATEDRLIEQQEHGVLALFRLIKSLLKSGYAARSLKWTIITQRTQRVRANDAIQAAHAGIAGLIGSVAKEYPRWDLRLLDVDSLTSVSAQECLSLPWDKQGNVLAHRSGEWFQQSLARVESLPEATPLYRQNGVYVVIGGAGGVGEVWSRFMIERHQARIVWIGRRPSGTDIEARIQALAGVGCAPLYISADATDLRALERARETIVERYGVIHGVVQSAIVLQDQSVARMDESTFQSTLSAKVDVSVNMERVFGGQSLDFMLFFSSLISFVKTPGQSNYSAGCTFKDAFAHRLQQERSYPVKIMNWGYWGSVGIVADEEHKKRMARMGAASIEPEEGMAALQSFVNSDASQIALVKLLAEATEVGPAEALTCYPKAAPSILPKVRVTPPSVEPLEADTPAPEMLQTVTEILASSLESVGWKVSAAPYFERWLCSTMDYLKQQGVGREVRPLDELWTSWAANRASWTVNANREAYLTLMEACLKALPNILTRSQRPTDVMFPNSSMRLVEPIYKGNAQADYFNGALGKTLIACLDQLLQAGSNRSIRILEIGAGTGGTTAGLLPLLREYPIEEYCYTDLSKAFLMHAEKHYRPQLPALATAIFDVTKPLASQSIKPGHYDVAIAANVLHATPNIRETLRNAKAALKNQGVLLLNELSNWNILAHVTFGLLEGWWLYEDVALRLPGTPGIGTGKWRDVLAEEGFESVLFTAPDAHKFGQQIIAAGSNGWVRQRVVKVEASRPAAGVRPVEPVAAAQRTPRVSSEHIRRVVTDALSEALKVDPSTIRDDEPFAEYGVDSIVGVNLVTTINEKLQIDLETVKLFEYTTIEQLVEHIATATEYREQSAAPPASQVPTRLQDQRRAVPTPVEIRSHVEPVSSPEVSARMSGDYVRGVITGALAEALRLDAESIRGDEPFADYGVDSIIGVKLVTTIGEKLEIELETTKLFEYTTVNQLTDYIQSEWGGRIATLSASVLAAVEPEVRREHRFATSVPPVETARDLRGDEQKSPGVSTGRIAIVGISGRFAESENLDEFWHNLKEGKDLVKTVTRWKTTDCIGPAFSGRYCAEGSFIDSIDRFDPAYFRISPEEAVCMDPQQRLFLEESWKALEDAGYGGKSVRKKQCGVYVGCIPSRYIDLMGADSPAHALWGTAESIIPTRIAYNLDLQGPAIAIDTACSSSLVAIHLACQALWTRETDMALAGGVFLQPTPGFYLMANGAGMLSTGGRCFSFDQRADGYVPGEGVGVVVLKRLEDALAEGDHIHGVIVATGINQDGSSNGLVAPNARAQERLERSVYDRFGINPETIQFVEAHGSGTLLGDSIEYGALSRAFRAYTDKTQFCALGTLKTNFGHTVTAAGVAGVLKVVLAMKHRQIPPSLHIQKPIAGKTLESSPFYFNSDRRDWTVEDHQPRRAAVSSFGFNGTNAHLVIEEAPAVPPTIDAAGGYLLALSARTDEQLRQQIINLLARLKSGPRLSMNDLSFTLLLGRVHLKHRLACVVRDQAEAVRLLEQWLAGGMAGPVWSAQASDSIARDNASLANLGNRAIRECRTATNAEYLENLTAIANLHLQGHELEFEALFPAESKRIPLPTYPFARERYWVDEMRAIAPVAAVPASSRLHPLLHRNTSVLGRQSYSSTFMSHESFEAACLEMARAAVEHAAGVTGGILVELQDVVWGEPLVIDGMSEVTIALVAEDDDSIAYEVYSSGGTLHCQGRAVLFAPSVPTPLENADLLMRVSVEPGDSGCALPPVLMTAVLQAAGSNSGARPRAIEHLRIVSPCGGEISVVMKRKEGGVDVDLIDASGHVSVQLRGLSFQQHDAVAAGRRWTFSKEGNGASTMIPAAEKMTLFLRQEIALQLQKSIDDIPTDVSFFDLGLTSLKATTLVQSIQNSCALLNEDDFSPSVLFNYTDIRSLASYLAATYPSTIDRIAVAQIDPAPQREVASVSVARLKPITRRHRPPIRTEPAVPVAAAASLDEILASVSWQEASLLDGYETVPL
jgi:polyketide synthase PksM